MRLWLSGLSPRRRRLVLGLAVVGLVAVVLLAVALVRPDRTGPAAQDRPGTVLLVPGYGGSRDALVVLADRIRSTGRSAEVVTLAGDGTGDLRAQVAVLDRAIDGAVSAGAPSVDLIGYSAGGVVTRLWVADNPDSSATRRVVTLGAPLHGATLAAVGGAVAPDACPLACQQLAPGSALLGGVDRQELPGTLPWLSVWTENDETVVPADSARLDGAVNVALQQVCPLVQVSHSQLPTDPLVTGLVLRALGTDELRAPAAADCDPLTRLGASS